MNKIQIIIGKYAELRISVNTFCRLELQRNRPSKFAEMMYFDLKTVNHFFYVLYEIFFYIIIV